MSVLALDLFSHIPGWFEVTHIAEGMAKLFFAHPEPEHVAFMEVTLYGWFLVAPVLLLVALAGTRKLERVPSGLQNVLEGIVTLLDNFSKEIIGEKHYLHFSTYIGVCFLYILASNLCGLIPAHGGMTSVASTTVALALCTFVATHYAGFRFAGGGYLKHFAGEPLWLAPLMIPIHIIGELARPLSLAMRLMGNVSGEEKVVAIFVCLGMAMGAALGGIMYDGFVIPIPVQLPLAALGVFTGFVQALIFSLLSAVYIAGALPHEHHDHGHHDHAAHGAVAPA